MRLNPKMIPSPKNEADLLNRCNRIEGLSFGQLAMELDLEISSNALERKGWGGLAIELALGADAGNQAKPDFLNLSIELKTLPINQLGKPAESTFITSIPLLTIHQEQWQSSQCYSKLKRVLWVPVEGDNTIPYQHRRIGRAFLWSPDSQEETILSEDWNYLTSKICLGQLAHLDATVGTYLQVRPKAANGKSLCYGYDEDGSKIKTLPRGFYLRSLFTEKILLENNG